MSDGARHGGLVLRAAGKMYFAPIAIVVKVVSAPRVEPIPGAPPALAGVALVDGEAIPVLTLGPGRGPMLVATWLGERLGLVGLDPVASGTFPTDPASPQGVIHAGEPVPALDLAELCATVQRSPWA